MIDIREALVTGHYALQALKQAKEVSEQGILRIGNAGILAKDKQIYGICHRVSLARLLGHQPPPNISSRIMFAAGERNEDTWADVLTAAGWTVDRTVVVTDRNMYGRPIMGHPEIVLKKDGQAVLGLELKGIYGASTLEAVLKGRPKNDNLIQAAAYSLYLNLPYALCYTLPAWTKLGSVQVKPLDRIFYLEWRDEVLWYADETDMHWYRTAVTTQSIRQYFDNIDDMLQARDLGNRPSGNYVDGSRHKWGPDSICTFCPFKSACARYDNTRDYAAWIYDISQCTGEDDG